MATNALDMLKEDHDKVRGLLNDLAGASERAGKKRKDLLETIEKELKVHTQVEDEIFYPAFKEANGSESNKMYFEAKEEHRAIEELILPDLKKADPDGDQFSGRCKVLKELVEHHAEDEETEMFPRARKTMSEDKLVELGEQIERRKKELMG